MLLLACAMRVHATVEVREESRGFSLALLRVGIATAARMRANWRIAAPTLQYARPVGPAAFQASDRRFSFVKARRCDVLISLSGETR